MAADFLLMFVKLPEHCAYFLQTLVVIMKEITLYFYVQVAIPSLRPYTGTQHSDTTRTGLVSYFIYPPQTYIALMEILLISLNV